VQLDLLTETMSFHSWLVAYAAACGPSAAARSIHMEMVRAFR
jgi:hypothetical protein